MNKTFLLLGAAVLSASVFAADFIGYGAVELNNEITSGTSSIEKICTNAHGDAFFIGNAGSVGATPTATFMEIEASTAPFKQNMKQTNTNLVFGTASLQESVAPVFGTSNRGNIKSKAAVATDKGELYIAVAACHSDSNRLGDNKALQVVMKNDAGLCDSAFVLGEYDATKATQYGAVLCVTAKGVHVVCTPTQIENETAGFSIVDLATDGTNFYLLTVLTKGIAIDKDTIRTKSAKGSLAVLKFDSNWKLVASAVSEGTEGTTTGTLKYINGKLYYAGNFSAQANGTFSFGGKTLTSSKANNGILAATLSTDLVCEQLSYTGIEKNTAGKGGNITVYDELVDGENAYFTGFFNGQIAYGETDTVACTATRAFVAKVNLTTGKTEKAAVVASTGISGGAALLAHKDTISMYAYDWSSNQRISLYHYDQNLQPIGTTALILSSGSDAVQSAVLTPEGILLYAFRTKGTVTFASDTTQSYTAQDSGFRGVLAVERLYEAVETAISDAVVPETEAQKFFRNGQLYIRRGKTVYNALGQEIE